MTSKESLKYIFNLALNYTNRFSNQTGFRHNEAYDIIKQDLDRLEAIDNANPIEALEELFKTTYFGSKEEYDKINNCYNSIKLALLKAQEQEKENKVLKACIKDWEDDYEHLKFALEKREKALEIIKKKKVDIFSLKKCIELDLPLTDEQRLHKYNHDYMMIGMEQLTKEEFNLLREVLDNE